MCMNLHVCVSAFIHLCSNMVCFFCSLQSLYPYVLKTCEFPTCHPVVIRDPEKFDYTLEPYFGLVKCKVLAPRDLFLPVLPFKSAGRLMFPLCGTCAVKLNQGPCQCSEDDRSMLSSWTTFELRRAIKTGYKVLKIYEVLHFPETSKFDPYNPNGAGLFQVWLIKLFFNVPMMC